MFEVGYCMMMLKSKGDLSIINIKKVADIVSFSNCYSDDVRWGEKHEHS